MHVNKEIFNKPKIHNFPFNIYFLQVSFDFYLAELLFLRRNLTFKPSFGLRTKSCINTIVSGVSTGSRINFLKNPHNTVLISNIANRWPKKKIRSQNVVQFFKGCPVKAVVLNFFSYKEILDLRMCLNFPKAVYVILALLNFFG